MRILIVSYSCAPLNIISAQRVNALAKYLAKRGHSVDLLTAVKHLLDGPLDGVIQKVELDSFAEVHEVEFLGRRRRGFGPSPAPALDAGLSSSPARSVLKKARAALVRFVGALFDYRTIWAFSAVRYYAKKLANRNYDVVISSSGPVGVNYVGFRIKRMSPQVRWVADFRDLWSLLHSTQVTPLTRRGEMILEKTWLQGASAITTVSSHLAEQMRSLHSSIPVHVVRNGFLPEELAEISPASQFFRDLNLESKTNIVYAGSIYAGRRDPFPLIDAIARSPIRDRIALHFFGFSLGELESEIKRRKVSDFCHVHSSQPRERILGIQKAAHINLFLESGAADAEGVLTGKLFELAGLAIPILSIGPPAHFESMAILKKTGLLMRWESFEGDVERLLAASMELRPDLEFISTLARDAQFNHMLSVCEVGGHA